MVSATACRWPWKPRLEILEDRNLLSIWSTVASLPTPRGYLAAVKGADSQIYALGGQDSTNTELNTVEAYQPVTNTWTRSTRRSCGRGPPGSRGPGWSDARPTWRARSTAST